MALKLITSPAAEPVTLADAKSQLRVTHSDDDTLIARLISTARDHIERDAQRAIATATYELALDQFPDEDIRIDFAPVQSITSVKYDDTSGIEQTLSTASYFLDGDKAPAWVTPIDTGWPTTLEAVNTVRVRYVAGYASGLVPPSLQHAILLLVAEWYENREASVEGTRSKLPHAVDRLVWPHRVFL